MISTINHKLARQRRDAARRPLIALLRSCAAHAMLPLAGREITPDTLLAAESAVRRGLRALADAGALAYFGIHDGAELGTPPVTVFVFDDGRPPYGKVDVEVEPLVAWVFTGGAAGRGWRAPGRLGMADLSQ